jgi:hypothetical protein
MPAFVALTGLACRRSVVVEEPTRNPPGPIVDAATPTQNPPVLRVDPQTPPVHMMGAVAPVRATPPTPPPSSALPAPAAAPSAAAPGLGALNQDRAAAAVGVPSSGLPGALAADTVPAHPDLAGRAPGVYLVHNHPPGTPCRPVAQTDVQAAAAAVGAPR